MRDSTNKVLLLLAILFSVFLHSCILDEFKIGDVHLKDEWQMDIISPLFYGNFIFGDLAGVNDSVPLSGNGPFTVLVSGNDTVTYPLHIFYEPALLINGFNFLIEGDDYLSSATFIYTVKNGSPLPLNVEMYFYEKEKPEIRGPAFLPPPFNAGMPDNGTVVPSLSTYSLQLDAGQLESFKKSNRIDFITWFEPPVPGIQTDTLQAGYPIDISIIFSGKIQRNYE